MNFQQLRCIREGQRRSFNLTEVAATPHASQPGVSRQIRALEDALGIDIFMLAGKRLTGLSEPGTYGMPIIEKLLSEAENLRRAGTDYAQTGAGTLRIAATHSQVREEPALQTGFSFALSRRSALFRKNGGCWLRVELSGRSSQRNSLVYGLVGLSTAVWPLKHCSKLALLVFMMRLPGSMKLSCAFGSGWPKARLTSACAGAAVAPAIPRIGRCSQNVALPRRLLTVAGRIAIRLRPIACPCRAGPSPIRR